MEENNVLKLQEKFEAYSALVMQLDQIAMEQDCEEARADLRKAWLRLRQGPVRALVMGVSSAGKSTLINALTGQIVVPEAKRVMSPIPVWICSHNALDMLMVEILKKGKDIIQDPQYCGLAKFLVDYNYTPKDAGRGTGQKKFKNVIAARVNLKSDAISDAGITLIDTPGIGASPKDDALVAEVLKSGCELLIVASMDNSFQEAKVKDYFRDLLVEEDAPLRSVWEAGRAFFVCNVTKSAIRHARENVRTHIKDAFKGWDPEGRLFIVNARDARIRACGVYDYPFFLGGSCTEEERKHAEESMKDEEVRKGKAKEQPELEAFCQSLGQAAQELCANPEECQKILTPIQEELKKAGSLLKKLVKEKQKKVKVMDFDFMVLPELKKYSDELEKALSKLQEQSKTLEKLDDGRAFSEKEWPLNKPWKPVVNARYLIADEPNRMGEILLQDIESQNWHYRIASRVSERMNVLLREHLAAMEEEAKLEFQVWRLFFDDFRGILASVDPRGKRLLPPEKVELFWSEVDKLLSEAEAAGQEAMRSSPAYVLSPEKRFQLGQYLAEKRLKVLAGGLKGRWARFWLDSNVDIDQLSPLATSAAAEGRRAFLTAYRDKLWNGKKSAISELRRKLGKLLAMIGDELHKQSQIVNQQIENEKETARKKQLDELQKPLGAIREIMESAERMENNE